MIEELKQRVLAKAAKIRQHRQTRMFTTDQKKVYIEINGQLNTEKITKSQVEKNC